MIGLVLDIETTGWYNISPHTGTLTDDSEILEVGYIRVDMDTCKVIDCNELYFYKPYFEVESQAQSVHGITRDFLEPHADEFKKNLVILNSVIQRTCIIGKNTEGFDIKFIKEFLRKHSGKTLDIAQQVMYSNIKTYDGRYMGYDVVEYSLDLQKIFAPKYRELYYSKNGIELNSRKKGTLSEYIEILNMQGAVDSFYKTLPRKRETRAHGALYDAVMTYVVWLYCKANKLY